MTILGDYCIVYVKRCLTFVSDILSLENLQAQEFAHR